MTQEMREAAKRQQDAIAVMQDAVKQMSVTGLTDARKAELDTTFSRAEADLCFAADQAWCGGC